MLIEDYDCVISTVDTLTRLADLDIAGEFGLVICDESAQVGFSKNYHIYPTVYLRLGSGKSNYWILMLSFSVST